MYLIHLNKFKTLHHYSTKLKDKEDVNNPIYFTTFATYSSICYGIMFLKKKYKISIDKFIKYKAIRMHVSNLMLFFL